LRQLHFSVHLELRLYRFLLYGWARFALSVRRHQFAISLCLQEEHVLLGGLDMVLLLLCPQDLRAQRFSDSLDGGL